MEVEYCVGIKMYGFTEYFLATAPAPLVERVTELLAGWQSIILRHTVPGLYENATDSEKANDRQNACSKSVDCPRSH